MADYDRPTVPPAASDIDEEIAERADWEFIPLSDATEKAGWELADDAE